jgi:CBS domain-containing protein
MKVAEIMTVQVEFISPDATAQDAAAMMGELDVSALPLGSPESLQGVVTHRDLLYRVVAEGRDPKRTRVREIATSEVISCRSTDSVHAAMELMAGQNLRRLPVSDEGRIVGWLTLSDIASKLLVGNQLIQNGLLEAADQASAGEAPTATQGAG